MFRRPLLTAALVAATTLPAAAEGHLSLTVSAGNADESRAIRAGLAIYRIAQGVESGAFVHQDGALNGAAIAQVAGGGSTGVIHQEGDGHAARLDQQGHGQAHGIFQFGDGADANVTQTQTGQTGLTFQFGFD